MIYTFATEQYDHQRTVLDDTWDRPGYAWWWEPGLGKSKELIDNGGLLYCDGAIGGTFYLGPNGLHRNFITKEVPKHLDAALLERTALLYWRTDKASTKWFQESARAFLKHDGYKILSMSYDGLMTDTGRAFAKQYLIDVRCLYGADETQRIKEPTSARSIRVVASGTFAPFRRIMTGTPVANAPWDVYPQIKFLDADFWKPHGLDSPEAMKSAFGIWGSAMQRVPIGATKRGAGLDAYYDREGIPSCLRTKFIVKPGADGGDAVAFKIIPTLAKDDNGSPMYRDLDRLRRIVAPIRSRVLKDDVLDLPPKVHTPLEFEMSAPQRRAYDSMVKMGFVMLESGETCSARLALTVMLRLQQIACGYLVTDVDPLAGDDPKVLPIVPNPRLDLLLELTQDLPHQALIWSRFTPDIDAICAALRKQGKTVARYDGAISDDECAFNEEAFHRGDAQFFVSNQAKGGEGLTLVEAQTAIYYANSFKLIERLQSSDRPYRIGQTKSVNEIDLVAVDTMDARLIVRLQGKYDVAAMVNGDVLHEWLLPLDRFV